jgi:hypothetical protein
MTYTTLVYTYLQYLYNIQVRQDDIDYLTSLITLINPPDDASNVSNKSHECWHVLAVMFGHPSQISMMWNTQLTTWHLFVHVCLPAALSSYMERDIWEHERWPLALIASLSARVVYTNPSTCQSVFPLSCNLVVCMSVHWASCYFSVYLVVERSCTLCISQVCLPKLNLGWITWGLGLGCSCATVLYPGCMHVSALS